MVAAKAHQKGSTKSAKRPRTRKTIQKIFFCIGGIVGVLEQVKGESSFARLDSRGRLSLHGPIIRSRLAGCERLIVTTFYF